MISVAATRFIPTPPAFVEIKKTSIGSRLKRVIA